MFGAKTGSLLSVFAVAHHAGAGIEMESYKITTAAEKGRSPRGSGD